MSERPKRVILLTPRMIDSIVRQLNALPVPRIRKHTPPPEPITRAQSLKAWFKLTLSLILVPNPIMGYLRLGLLGLLALISIAANVAQLLEYFGR